MEFEDLNRGYLSHPRRHDPDRLAAWREGRTGYPLIDACMRCLLKPVISTFARGPWWCRS